MKKVITMLSTIILCSCASTVGRDSTIVYSDFPAAAPIHIRNIVLEPPHILNGISDELPELIKSCLVNSGYTVSDDSSSGVFELDVFFHKQDWQHNFSPYESVTLRLFLSKDDKTAAYRLYTVDTDKSIDSFSWTLSLIEENISQLTAAIY